MTEVMQEKELRQAFSNLNVWKSGDQRAPHKPLLILYAIARYLEGHDRLIAYRDVEDPLKHLLREFGPGRKSYQPCLSVSIRGFFKRWPRMHTDIHG